MDEKVFLFDLGVDCVAYGGYLFINRVTNFQRIFQYFERLRASAENILDAIVARVPVVNEEELREACRGQIQMLSKLHQISTKPYFDSVTMADIQRTIETFGLEVEITMQSGSPELVFERNVRQRWLILKLLDDDFLGSQMTGINYAANSKTTLN